MALRHEGGVIVPIGCSCIGSFELALTRRFPDARHEALLFDWTIATPDATCDVLEFGGPVITQPGDFELHGHRIRAKRFPGLYFWHILNEGTGVTLFDDMQPVLDNFQGLKEKYAHLTRKLFALEGPVTCIWSNIQPNLKEAVEEAGLNWADFRLTGERYHRIRQSVRRLSPDGDVACYFVCRAEDIAPDLADRPDVFVLDCPRGPLGQGAPGIFDPVLARIARDAGIAPAAAEHRTVSVKALAGTFWAEEGDLITQQLQVYGAHTRNELSMVLDFLDPGSVVLDIGAHIGTYAIPMARKAGPAGRVLAIEANEQNFSLLERNIAENGLRDRITPLHRLMSSQKGGFTVLRQENNSGNTVYLPAGADEETVSVDTATLEELRWFAERHGRLDLLKLDVEGMELEVLQSGEDLIRTFRPAIYLEINAELLDRNGVKPWFIGQFLRPMGYRFFRNQGPRNSMHDAFCMEKLDRLTNHPGLYDALCLPIERVPAAYLHPSMKKRQHLVKSGVAAQDEVRTKP